MGIFSFLGGKSPEELELEGDKYFKIEEFGVAKIEYEKALAKAQKKFPEKSDFISHLLEKITRTKESLAKSHLKYARSLIQSGNHDEAEGLLHLILELSGDESIKEKAMKELKVIQKGRTLHIAQGPDAEETLLKHYDQEEDDNNLDDYFSILCSTLPEESHDEYHEYGQFFKSGYVALNSGDFETAAVHLEAAMREYPDSHSQIPLELATALVHLHQFNKAADVLKPFIVKNPDSLRGYQILCEVYWDTGDFEQALDLLRACPDNLRDGLSMRMLLGETYYQSGNYPEAVRIFERIITDFGFNEMIARSLAKAHEATGNLQKAMDLYSQIMIGCKTCGTRTDPFIKGRYADLCFQSGEKSDRLLELYFSLAQEDPDNANQYYHRIHKIYEYMGNDEQSRRYQTMADAITP